MTENMKPNNVLFLIGNGFDLAHGLKTGYCDFLLWYLNKIYSKAIDLSPENYNDGLVSVQIRFQTEKTGFDKIEDLTTAVRQNQLKVFYKNNFFRDIVASYSLKNWVDIEYAYFQVILGFMHAYEKHGSDFEDSMKALNECLDVLKDELVEYLTIISPKEKNPKILENLLLEFRYNNFKDVRFLVFNYTNTIELYLQDLELQKNKVINIHGKLNDKSNPIIFGYGDEIHPYYSKIEDFNKNQYLRQMKSFGYFKTDKYRKLIDFIDSDYFKVCIMGHSCGISDRVLLNTIFCHEKCNEIQIYYHQREPEVTDFDEKTMEISRHFKPTDKGVMRKRVNNLRISRPLS